MTDPAVTQKHAEELEASAARIQRQQDADRAWDLIVSMYGGLVAEHPPPSMSFADAAERDAARIVNAAFAIVAGYNAKREEYVGAPVEPK